MTTQTYYIVARAKSEYYDHFTLDLTEEEAAGVLKVMQALYACNHYEYMHCITLEISTNPNVIGWDGDDHSRCVY